MQRLGLCIGALLAVSMSAQIAVPTVQYNNLRNAANPAETSLTTANVKPATFGKLFSRAVDESVYASPLIMPNVLIPGQGTHNVMYVATMNNSVYAFDADDPAQAAPLWFRNLGTAQPSPSGDISSKWGILSTPVIYNGVLYLVAYIGQSYADWSLYLCALDITTGADVYGPPAPILFPKNGGMVPATTGTIQRAGLLAANGKIYIGFSNFDSVNDQSNQIGFVYAYSSTNITAPVNMFQPVQNRGDCGGGVSWRGGDIWQAGRGLAADSAGNVYVQTGNGYYDGLLNFGDTLLKLTPSLTLADSFTPNNRATLCELDLDLGAGGPILIPSLNYVIGGGKEGVLYVLNQSRLGGLQSKSSSGPVTQFHATRGCNLVNCGQSLSMAYWERPAGSMLFVWDDYDVLRAFTFNGPRLGTTPVATGSVKPNYAGGVSVSSNGNAPGSAILWAITSADTQETAPNFGTVRAYDATDITHELWDSDMNAARDALGKFTKFSIPVVANGKVYAITQAGQVQVYGLLSPPPATARRRVTPETQP